MSRKLMDYVEKDNGNDFRNPRTRVQTTAARTESTNTTVYSDTSFNGNSGTIRYETTSRTVTREQVAHVTQTNTSFYTANMDEISSMFPQLTTSRTFPAFFATEQTTVTQNSGRNVTSKVEEQHIKFDKTTSNNMRHEFFNTNPTAFNNSTARRTDSMLLPNQFKRIDAQPFATSRQPNLLRTSSTIRPSTSGSPLSSITTSPYGTIPKSPSTPTLQKNFAPLPRTTSVSSNTQDLKPGIAYIFNNENFDDDKSGSRVGTDADSDNLNKTLNALKLTVEVHKDATFSKIKSVVKTISNKDFKKYSCLVIAILTHGSRNERVQARDKTYSIDDDILFPIMKNASLMDKPKIFFIQACKGFMEVEDFHKDKPLLNGMPSEIIKCYSTFEGYVSYRTEQGTFFIQKLCEELQKNGKTVSIQEIMRSVTAAVKQFTNGKQVPTMTVNLTKDFVFGDYM